MSKAKAPTETKRKKIIPDKQPATEATRGQGGRKVSESDQGKKV